MYAKRPSVARSNSRLGPVRPSAGTGSSQTQTAFIKCVVVGDGRIGKTCLLLRYCTDKFEQDCEYKPTIFENYQHSLQFEESNVRLLLFDTAGQEDYDRVRQLVYPQTDVFILCFSPFLESSFHNVYQRWIPELHRTCPDVPILLVATQSDLRRSPEKMQELEREGETVISLEKGIRMAQQVNAVGYLECSALTSEGVEDVFLQAVEIVLKPEKKKLKICQTPETPTGCKLSGLFCCCASQTNRF